MIKVSEATISGAMQDVIDEFFPKYKEIIGYDNSSEWKRNNPTTGKLLLRAYPNCKQAWVLVKFTELKKGNYGKSIVPQQRKTIRTPDEFREFFGVAPAQNFFSDTVITCSWDKQEQQNHNTQDRFDSSTPDFYVYMTHRSDNPERIALRMVRLKAILDSNPSSDSPLHNATKMP